MTKHTNGPWVIDEAAKNVFGGVTGIYIAKKDEGRIGEVFLNCLVTSEEELTANAKLFSAAPELLKALQDILSNQDIFDSNLEIKAREAIQKATI